MDFQVSARKWRPQKFCELIGQDHIVRTLTNALELDRVAHAYLFSGTRGVGKTTTARILAKALNCAHRSTPEPCDGCPFCREIRDGASIDVQEIDGASNNGVAEVRDLIENVQYAPSAAPFKIYIIDEVHMLSRSAFNALLKTLEEPPPHVVFVFATTELHKIPETILSRCQCFEFKPLSHKQIVRQLELICAQEGIEVDALSLQEIAKNGAGSMRDAQSLLDQVVAYCGRTISPGSVEAVLGIVGRKALETFVDTLIAKDAAGLIGQIQDITNSGKDLQFFCRDLAEYLRHLLLVARVKQPETLLDTHTLNLDALKRQAQAFDPDQLHQMFTVLSRAETEMKRSTLSKMVFEMAVLRLTEVRPFQQVDALIEKINQMERESGTDEVPRAAGAQATAPPPAGSRDPAPAPAPTSPEPRPDPDGAWARLQQEICARKTAFGHYLTGCWLVALDEKTVRIGVDDAFTLERLEQPDNLQILRAAVRAVLGGDRTVELTLRNRETREKSAAGDEEEEKTPPTDYNKARNLKEKSELEIVQEALEIFGGIVIR